MPNKTRPKKTDEPAASTDAGDGKPRTQKDAGWEDRLRLTGDARFIDVQWSGRDNPSWPLPVK